MAEVIHRYVRYPSAGPKYRASEELAAEGAKNPVLQEAFAKAGMPTIQPQVLKVHNHFITSELQARA